MIYTHSRKELEDFVPLVPLISCFQSFHVLNIILFEYFLLILCGLNHTIYSHHLRKESEDFAPFVLFISCFRSFHVLNIILFECFSCILGGLVSDSCANYHQVC